jgi:microcin C transport system permease protein
VNPDSTSTHSPNQSTRTPRWQLNPVARKRWKRFRNHRRGFWSLILLTAMYVISLGAELICNDRPLYVRFEGKSYFPVFRFYPEDDFAGNGILTRPDYKKLLRSELFETRPENWMLFPVVPHGPNEIIDPATLRGEERVTLTIRHTPKVGTVNVDEALMVMRSQSADVFTAGISNGMSLETGWDFPASIRNAITQRMANQSDDALRVILTNRINADLVTEVSLATFTPRNAAPRDVRMTFREIVPEVSRPRVLHFARNLVPDEASDSWWQARSDEEKTALVEAAKRGYDGTYVARPIHLEGIEHTVDISRNEVRWPFKPVPGHWLGVDNAGRDVFARILYGLRTSMTFGLLLVAFSMGFGTFMGALQGYYGGKVDLISQRVIEVWSTIPFLYVMIWLGSLYGRGFVLLLVCYGIFNWIGISSYVRAEFLRLRRMPFVDAARCLGLSGPAIMFRHILPNALTPIITFFPFSLVGAIGSLAMLDYLGFGLPPPTPSWGELLHQAQSFRWAWWLILYPSLALFVVMLLGVFIGEGVRDANDPKPVMRME